MDAYLEKAGVSPDGEVELGGICDQQDVAVDVDGGTHRLEVQCENALGLVRKDEDGRAEVVDLSRKIQHNSKTGTENLKTQSSHP